MAARNRARYLAPLALVATIAGTYVIVQNGLTAKHAHSRTPTPVQVRAHGALARATYYSVQAGDNLTSIAAKTGVPLSTIEALNPNVNPNSLQTGQQLRLRR